FIPGIDPEQRAEGPAPRITADAGRVLAGFLALFAEYSKAVAHKIVAREHDADVAKLVSGHLDDGFRLEHTGAVHFATIEHHLAETKIVAKRRDQPAAARIVLAAVGRRIRGRNDGGALSHRLVAKASQRLVRSGRIDRTQPRALFLRQDEASV